MSARREPHPLLIASTISPEHWGRRSLPRARTLKRWSALTLLLLGLLCSGCARKRAAAAVPAAPPAETPSPAWDSIASPTREAYLRALQAAQIRTPKAISTELLPLLSSTDGLVWNEQGRVLMVTWTRAEYYLEKDTAGGQSRQKYRAGKSFPLHGDTWFTAAPFLQDWCGRLGLAGDHLTLRLQQRLGLPPDDDKDAFLHVWVDPGQIFRPCPDPEISDRECQLEIAVVDRNDDVPWDCRSDRKQLSGAFVEVKQGHLDWMCNNWKSSYGNPDPSANYPWTALGYTFDWGNPDDPRGPSEFVVTGKSEVVFEKILSTAEFCRAP